MDVVYIFIFYCIVYLCNLVNIEMWMYFYRQIIIVYDKGIYIIELFQKSKILEIRNYEKEYIYFFQYLGCFLCVEYYRKCEVKVIVVCNKRKMDRCKMSL